MLLAHYSPAHTFRPYCVNEPCSSQQQVVLRSQRPTDRVLLFFESSAQHPPPPRRTVWAYNIYIICGLCVTGWWFSGSIKCRVLECVPCDSRRRRRRRWMDGVSKAAPRIKWQCCVTEPGKSTRVHWLIPFVVCEVRRVDGRGKVERALRVLSHRHTATEYMHMPS